MQTLAPADVLNRTLAIVYRSYPRYLQDAPPWIPEGDEKQRSALRRLAHVAADLETLSQRLVGAIQEADGVADYGDYPLVFAEWNDLSLKHIVAKAIEQHRRDLLEIERCIADLRDFPRPRAICEEVLGAFRGHLEILKEIQTELAGS